MKNQYKGEGGLPKKGCLDILQVWEGVGEKLGVVFLKGMIPQCTLWSLSFEREVQ